jgi:hypothetical protein
MHVLANAPEMRIVVLRDEGDAEGAIVPNYRQVR